MSGLVEFLRARFAEEQAEAEELADVDDYPLDPWAIQREETGEWNSYAYIRIAKARVLAEVAAKRRILDDVLPTMQADEMRIAGEWGVGSEPVREASDDLLSLLALPYADHPDYREEWKP